MPRAPYRPVEDTVALRPAAAPVNTFVQPVEPSRDRGLQDLARSLSGLGGSLGGFVEKRDKDAEENDRLRGEAAYHTSMRQGYAEGVSSGAIPAQASKSFMDGYKKAQGEVEGGVLEQKFATAYDAFEGKTSTDPKVYDQFVSGFLKDNIKTNDPGVLAGMLPKVRQIAANYLQRHIGDASRAAQDGYATALSAKGEQALNEANTTGFTTKTGTDYSGVFGTLDAIREEGVKSGANAQKVDEKLIDTVVASALSKRDPKLLDYLDRKVPGKDYTWGNTPYGRDQRAKAIDSLETMGRKSIADDEKRRRDDKAVEKDEVTRTLIGAITKDPNAPLPEELLARGEKVDPDFRVNAIRWRDTIGKGGQTSDNAQMLAVTTDILNGGGVKRVQRAIEDGVFKNPEDMVKAFKLAESMSPKEGAGPGDVLKAGSLKPLIDTIKKRTANEKDFSKAFDDGSMSDEGLQLTTDLKLQVLDWRAKNPEAGPAEVEAAIAKMGAGILGRIEQPEGDSTTVYANREGLPNANEFGAKAAPKVLPPEAKGPAKATALPPNPGTIEPEMPDVDAMGNALGGAPKVLPEAPPAKPATAPSKAPDAASWFGELPPETKQALELRAAREKKPLQMMLEETYQRGVKAGAIAPPEGAGKKAGMVAPDGTPIETASAGPSEVAGIGRAFEDAVDAPPAPDTVRLIGEAFERAIAGKAKPQGGYVSATLKDDPKAARILDFVAGPESGGNYNAFYANGRSTKDLSAMTFDQVVAWSGNRGTKSSATGRYQFMQKTLRGLKTEMGLSGSEPFTPALQDRMALQLLERRGYSAWQAGRITDAQFANRLALEWAALPNITPQNGRPAGVSAYANDGLNKSLVSPGSVLAALTGRVSGMFRRKAGSEQPDDGRDI